MQLFRRTGRPDKLKEAEERAAAELRQRIEARRAEKIQQRQQGLEDTTPLLEAHNIVRTYKSGEMEVRALRGVSLSIERGKFVALKGRSGSGKTTMLNIIGGLDRPTSGNIVMFGRDLATMNEAELTRLRRHEIGFVFQSFALLPHLSAFENVELALHIAGVPRKQRQERARECLQMVNLTRRADHRAYELSGGEQQRVAIARALTNRPSLILADEPTGELDSITAHQILQLFQDIVVLEDVTIVVATHDPLVMEIADITYELVDGQVQRIVREGSPAVVTELAPA